MQMATITAASSGVSGSLAAGGSAGAGSGSGPSVTELLKQRTWDLHKVAEGHALEKQLVGGSISPELFRALLGQRWHIHRVLEEQLAAIAPAWPQVSRLVQPELLQAPRAQRDLRFHGVDAEAVAALPATTAMCNHARALASGPHPLALLGMHYVFEGSKNGASYFGPRLAARLGLTPPDGVEYWLPHGSRQRELWMLYKASFDALSLSAADLDAMVQAARSTFDLLRQVDDELLAG